MTHIERNTSYPTSVAYFQEYLSISYFLPYPLTTNPLTSEKEKLHMYKFNSTYGSIRALIINSEPHFVSSDISSILGYTANAKALKLISEDCKKTYSKSELLPYDKGPEPLPTYSTFINTTGLWTLLTLNVTPQDNYLSSWIKSTVIPQLKSPAEIPVQTPTIFTNQDFGSVRVLTIDNEPWFVGKDVAEAFGDTNYR